MPWAAIGAVGSIASGIGSWAAQSSANDRAAALQNSQLQQWLQLNVPDPAQQKIVLQKFVQQGQLDPILQKAIAQNPSEFQKIVTNPANAQAQSRALSQLEDEGYHGGLTLQDKEAMQEAQLQGQAQARGQRQAIASQMEQRGLGGSGFDVAAQLQGQQGDADQAARSSLKIAADSRNRALQAIEGAGSLATQYRTQDFGEQAQKASAADRISQFNTQNARDVNQANVGLQNRAQEMNLGNAQDIANKNTGLTNQQSMYNNSLIQQQFDNQRSKLAGATGQANSVAGTDQHGGQLAGNAISNIGGALANTANAQAANDARAQGQADFWDKYFKQQQGGQQSAPQGIQVI